MNLLAKAGEVATDSDFLKWINGNLIDWTFEKYWITVRVSYGFMLFLALVLFLIIKAIIKKCKRAKLS